MRSGEEERAAFKVGGVWWGGTRGPDCLIDNEAVSQLAWWVEDFNGISMIGNYY